MFAVVATDARYCFAVFINVSVEKKNSFLFAISIYVRLLPLSLSKVFLKIHFGPDAWTNRQAAVNSYLRHKRNKTAHSVLVKQ